MDEFKPIIPEGVELKDTAGRIINDMRLRRMLGIERRFYEDQKEKAPIVDHASKWGYVQTVHVIGDIQIAEVTPKGSKPTEYHIYLNGRPQSRSAETLDMALIEALCVKYDGFSTRIPYYVAKMIGALPKEERANG